MGGTGGPWGSRTAGSLAPGCFDASIPRVALGQPAPRVPLPGVPRRVPPRGQRQAGGWPGGTIPGPAWCDPPAAAGALQVNQKPKEAWVALGGKVALECQVTSAEPWIQLHLEWLKDRGHGVLCTIRLNSNATAATTCGPHLHLTWRSPHAVLDLRDARLDDAGRYVCRVTLESPHLAKVSGNGTQLTVSAAPAAADDRHAVGDWVPDALDAAIYLNTEPRSEKAPKELVPPQNMESIHQEGLQQAWPPGHPACPEHPRHPGPLGAHRAWP
ncbi:uncharacterized protein [Struthio camelus]|uniref:uncharacterized protein isoform X3 n=1 Tax=Struthio camelus TaxID=8801 RepID=UPI003603F45C